MRVVGAYKTKAKWPVYVDTKFLPYVGYYQSGIPFINYGRSLGDFVPLIPGYNVLLHGSMMITGTGRGMSSVSFGLQSREGWRAHTTASGALFLFESIALGDTQIQHEEWRFHMTGPVVRGFWTVAKQGTEASLLPIPEIDQKKVVPVDTVVESR